MALVIYWHDLICYAIVGVAFLSSLRVLWRNKLENTRNDQLWTSSWKVVHPVCLLATRSVSLVVMVGLLYWDYYRWGVTVFIYYSGWTFSLIIVYFAIGTIMSVYGFWISLKQRFVEDEKSVEYLRRLVEKIGTTNSITHTGKEASGTIKLQTHYIENTLGTRLEFLGYLMQIIYQISAGAVVFVDIPFWCIFVPFSTKEQLQVDMLMGSMHILNFGLLLLDTILNNLPFPWYRHAYFVIWGCIYLVFQWVIHACNLMSWWPYPFLKLGPDAPLWYFILAVAYISCYGIYALIVKAKNSLFSRCFPKSFVTPYSY